MYSFRKHQQSGLGVSFKPDRCQKKAKIRQICSAPKKPIKNKKKAIKYLRNQIHLIWWIATRAVSCQFNQNKI